MAQFWRVPDGIRTEAQAVITGVLERQPRSSKIVGPEKSVARGSIEVGNQRFRLVAWGATADALATTPSGSVLRIEGELIQETWKVGSQTREQVSIKVTSFSVLERSDEQWTPRA